MAHDFDPSLLVAVAAATVTAAASIWVAFLNGTMNRARDAEKAEADRILEMIRTGGGAAARENLKFLLEAGLIANPERVRRLEAYLKDNPGTAPFLPALGRQYDFDRTSDLDESLEQTLQTNLDAYIDYLGKVGFDRPTPRPTVAVRRDLVERENWVARIDPDQGRIDIDLAAARVPDIARREYSHARLLAQRPADEASANTALRILESDLADYFVCSFADRPEFAPEAATIASWGSELTRTLDGPSDFTTLKVTVDSLWKQREVWARAFWAMRQALGRADADALLAKSWKELPAVRPRSRVAAAFVSVLLRIAQRDFAPGVAPRVRAILADRRFPVPKTAAG